MRISGCLATAVSFFQCVRAFLEESAFIEVPDSELKRLRKKLSEYSRIKNSEPPLGVVQMYYYYSREHANDWSHKVISRQLPSYMNQDIQNNPAEQAKLNIDKLANEMHRVVLSLVAEAHKECQQNSMEMIPLLIRVGHCADMSKDYFPDKKDDEKRELAARENNRLCFKTAELIGNMKECICKCFMNENDYPSDFKLDANIKKQLMFALCKRDIAQIAPLNAHNRPIYNSVMYDVGVWQKGPMKKLVSKDELVFEVTIDKKQHSGVVFLPPNAIGNIDFNVHTACLKNAVRAICKYLENTVAEMQKDDAESDIHISIDKICHYAIPNSTFVESCILKILSSFIDDISKDKVQVTKEDSPALFDCSSVACLLSPVENNLYGTVEDTTSDEQHFTVHVYLRGPNSAEHPITKVVRAYFCTSERDLFAAARFVNACSQLEFTLRAMECTLPAGTVVEDLDIFIDDSLEKIISNDTIRTVDMSSLRPDLQNAVRKMVGLELPTIEIHLESLPPAQSDSLETEESSNASE